MDGVRKSFWLIVPLGLAAGCGKGPDVPFPNWLSESRIARATETDAGAKRLYALAEQAERLSGAWLRRVSFTPGQRQRLIENLTPILNEAGDVCRTRVTLDGRSSAPFDVLSAQAGWRAIGRAFAWRIERSVALESFDAAAEDVVRATRFGLALTGGSASDAQLGYLTLDETRRAFVAALPRLTPAQLRRVGSGIEAALRNRPSSKTLVENERRSMLLTVQSVQDHFRNGELSRFSKELGKGIEPAIVKLRKLEEKPADERARYFESFAAEAKTTADEYKTLFGMNASQRKARGDFSPTGERPWGRFARHFFRALDPVLAMRDETICRTRLLGLNALLLAESKENGLAPSSLTGISSELTLDPYSGRSLGYRADGSYFLLYGIGPDLKDDAGETDAQSLKPDTQLESANR